MLASHNGVVITTRL